MGCTNGGDVLLLACLRGSLIQGKGGLSYVQLLFSYQTYSENCLEIGSQEDLGCLNPVFGSLWLSYDHIGKLSVLCIFCCNGFLLDHGAV